MSTRRARAMLTRKEIRSIQESRAPLAAVDPNAPRSQGPSITYGRRRQAAQRLSKAARMFDSAMAPAKGGPGLAATTATGRRVQFAPPGPSEVLAVLEDVFQLGGGMAEAEEALLPARGEDSADESITVEQSEEFLRVEEPPRTTVEDLECLPAPADLAIVPTTLPVRVRLAVAAPRRGQLPCVFESVPSFCCGLEPAAVTPRAVAKLSRAVCAPYITSLLFP